MFWIDIGYNPEMIIQECHMWHWKVGQGYRWLWP